VTEKIPIKKPTESEAALFEKLVSMVQMAKREGLDIEAAFLEELIDACVLELLPRRSRRQRPSIHHRHRRLFGEDLGTVIKSRYPRFCWSLLCPGAG